MDSEIPLIVATGLGPVVAVLITLWHQDRRLRIERKERLFTNLMAHRKSYPPTYDWVGNLNLIAVVFAGCPKVLTAWDALFDYFAVKPMDQKQYDYKVNYLLSQMADDIGIRGLQQMDIDKFYSPVAHGEQFQINDSIQKEWLRVLQNTESLSTKQKTLESAP